MAALKLFVKSHQNDDLFFRFSKGDERAFSDFYNKSFSSLLYIGRGLVNDDFLVSCILQECYLKVWAYRDKIESLSHAYRFIRLNLRWQILKQVQKQSYQIYRKMSEIDQSAPFLGQQPDVERYFRETDNDSDLRWDELAKAISFLPKQRQLIASLHFQHGHSPRDVAKRLGVSTLHINSEIQKSILELKRMVVPSPAIAVRQTRRTHPYAHLLNSDQAAVFELRQAQKKSFAEIAALLGYPQPQVQQHYIQAHQLIKNHGSTNGR